MALGFLFLTFVIMSVLALIGTVLLFVIKKSNANDVVLVLMAAYSMTIAYLNATAQPTNFVGAQILAWVIGLVAVAAVAGRFICKKQMQVFRILVAGSVIVGMYGLYFG